MVPNKRINAVRHILSFFLRKLFPAGMSRSAQKQSPLYGSLAIVTMTFGMAMTITGCLQTPRSAMMAASSSPTAVSSAPSTVSVEKASSRFVDTSRVRISDRRSSPLDGVFAEAQRNVDNRRFDGAEEKIKMIMETAGDSDSLAQEARFLRGEIFVGQNKFDVALAEFTSVMQTKGATETVQEKSLLRIGHVMCAQDKNDEADKVFRQFKNRFPSSSLLHLATCNAVGR